MNGAATGLTRKSTHRSTHVPKPGYVAEAALRKKAGEYPAFPPPPGANAQRYLKPFRQCSSLSSDPQMSCMLQKITKSLILRLNSFRPPHV